MVAAQHSSRSGTAVNEFDDFAAELESATRGFLEINVAVLEQMEKKISLGALSRAGSRWNGSDRVW